MTTVIAIVVFALSFTLFALLGPAERSRGCGGRAAGEGRCAKCPKGAVEESAEAACPGAKALRGQSRQGSR